MKKIYLGVNGVARKVKKAYLGVDNLARKVKKAYLGVNNVARPVMASEVAYFGEVTPLGYGRPGHMSGSTSDYALFAGGAYALNDCETYDKSLTYRSVTGLDNIKIFGASVSIDNSVIFAGGFDTGPGSGYLDVEKYDNSLTKSKLPDLSEEKGYVSGLDVGEFAVFVGGIHYQSGHLGVRNIDYYDKSGTHFTRLFDVNAYMLSSAKAGETGLFYGYSNRVYAFDTSLTMITLTDTDVTTSKLFSSGASIDDYAVFAGGQTNLNLNTSHAIDVTKVYDSSLTKVAQLQLKNPSSQLSGIAAGDYLIFAGGMNDTTLNDINCFDTSFTLKDIGSLKYKRRLLKAATVGSYAIFAGGCTSDFDTAVNNTEVFIF